MSIDEEYYEACVALDELRGTAISVYSKLPVGQVKLLMENAIRGTDELLSDKYDPLSLAEFIVEVNQRRGMLVASMNVALDFINGRMVL